jgi:hypothetical protein
MELISLLSLQSLLLLLPLLLLLLLVAALARSAALLRSCRSLYRPRQPHDPWGEASLFWRPATAALGALCLWAALRASPAVSTPTGPEGAGIAPEETRLVLLDLSRSMGVADATTPGRARPTGRLSAAVREVLARTATDEAPWAAVGYAAEVAPLCPPTQDRTALAQALRELPAVAVRQGGEPALALAWAFGHFPAGTRILWITDGDEWKGDALRLIEADSGRHPLELFPVGSVEGGWVPGPQAAPHLDGDGKPVFSRQERQRLELWQRAIERGARVPGAAAAAVAPGARSSSGSVTWQVWVLAALLLWLAAYLGPRGLRLPLWTPAERSPE